MATFALIHGGGSSAWDWHLVAARLEAGGHEVVAVDLPIEDDGADLGDYTRVVCEAVGPRRDVIVVGHSLGGFTAPLVARALDAAGLVYLTAMIPRPGETFTDWWSNTGYDQESVDDDPATAFFNGVPDALVREAVANEREQRGAWMSRPWPAAAYPSVPTAAVLCLDDAFFPAEFMRRQVRDRLGIEPTEVSGGHYAPLSNPSGVADALMGFASTVVPPS